MSVSHAESMRAMRLRRRAQGRREVRLVQPDARSNDVRARIAASVARLDRLHETEASRWAEAVSEFDDSETR